MFFKQISWNFLHDGLHGRTAGTPAAHELPMMMPAMNTSTPPTTT
jgi:hypothetical protein